MLYKLERNGKATEYYWQLDAGPLRQIGEFNEVQRLDDYFRALAATPDRFLDIPDLPELPEEPALCYTVPEAVASALAAGLDTSKRPITDSIRSAARQGRIKGAYRTPEGYWRLPVAAFYDWLAEHAEQRRGRPRKEAAAGIVG